jgi:DNA-binding transcriptional regulator YiaG
VHFVRRLAYSDKKNRLEIVRRVAYHPHVSMQIIARKAFTSTQKYRTRPGVAPERVRKIMVELKEYGLRHGLTQRQLAAMIGIKPQQLNDWLNRRREPTAERLLVVLEVLKTKPPKQKK